MEIKPTKRYIVQKFVYYAAMSFVTYLIAYGFMVLPFQSGASPDEVKILKSLPVGFGLIAFALSIFVQIQSALYVLRNKIKIKAETIEFTTGALSLDTTSIPLSQIEYANTNTTFFDSIFQTATISVGSDSAVVSVFGFDRSEAVEFADKISSSQKIRIKSD